MRHPTRRDLVVCGVDIGSTNTKVVALAPDGQVVARAGRPTPRSPHDLCVDAAVLHDAVEGLLVEVCAGTRVIAALSVVGVGEDGVLVDADGRPLVGALPWFDPRRDQVYRDLAPAWTSSRPGCPCAPTPRARWSGGAGRVTSPERGRPAAGWP